MANQSRAILCRNSKSIFSGSAVADIAFFVSVMASDQRSYAVVISSHVSDAGHQIYLRMYDPEGIYPRAAGVSHW